MEMIEGCMGKNQNLGRYDFRYNMITTDGKCEDSYENSNSSWDSLDYVLIKIWSTGTLTI
jgi:hypothetical protein